MTSEQARELREAAERIVKFVKMPSNPQVPGYANAKDSLLLARFVLERVGEDEGEEITIEWLKEQGFESDDPSAEHAEYSANGLHLSHWTYPDADSSHWRWQIGGNENMWACLHTPTRGFVRFARQSLGVSLEAQNNTKALEALSIKPKGEEGERC